MLKEIIHSQRLQNGRFPQLMADVVRFVRQPHDDVKELPTRDKVVNTAVLLIVKIVLSLIIAGIVGIFYEVQNKSDQSLAARFTPVVYLLLGTFFFPVLEETTYRLSLRFKPVHFALTMGAFTYTVVTKIIYQTRHSDFETALGVRLTAVLVVAVLTYLITSRTAVKARLQIFWQTHFRAIYYFSAVAFAWIHIFNFELNALNLLLLPILTLPQLISGLLVGYVRINYGFVYNLASHSATNFLFILLSFIPLD